MREIKFRAWDREHKKFSELPLKYEIKDINFCTDYDWMQYTGLKDRNGKEIYEGDIAVGEHATYSIWWDDRKAQYKAKVEKTKSVLIRHNSFPLWQYVEDDGECRIEVIGNIYENPHSIQEEEKK